MSKVLHPILLLAAKFVHAQLVRENGFLKLENRILRSRVKDKVIPTPEERAELVRFGRELGPALKKIISVVLPITFAKWLRWAANRDPSTSRQRSHRRRGQSKDQAACTPSTAASRNPSVALPIELPKSGRRRPIRSRHVGVQNPFVCWTDLPDQGHEALRFRISGTAEVRITCFSATSWPDKFCQDTSLKTAPLVYDRHGRPLVDPLQKARL